MSELSRLRWRCRRGTRELDTLLGRFLEHGYPGLDDAGRAAFERLLEQEDDRLADWLLYQGDLPTDGPLADIIRRIRQTV